MPTGFKGTMWDIFAVQRCDCEYLTLPKPAIRLARKILAPMTKPADNPERLLSETQFGISDVQDGELASQLAVLKSVSQSVCSQRHKWVARFRSCLSKSHKIGALKFAASGQERRRVRPTHGETARTPRTRLFRRLRHVEQLAAN